MVTLAAGNQFRRAMPALNEGQRNMKRSLKRGLAVAAASATASTALLVGGAGPAGAWCYSVGSHVSATLDWEFNGSDANIKWSGDHQVSAVRDLNYSSPTLNKSWVRKSGSYTKLTAGGGARGATWSHRVNAPYGALYGTADKYARRLSADLQACT